MSAYTLKAIRTQMMEDFLAEQKRQREEFDAKMRNLDEKIAEAERAELADRADPEVLVRASVGARRTIYHSAAHPCGRTQYDGGRQDPFTRMRESEAKRMDGGALKRCPSCWRL
ncbi:hypothetical protein ACFVY9_01480 [Streptomyces sp. NPDC059544]|uniref:hypothetical protein n=1 Tax=Streptomyces sp. NPDC059544 TaxID=3346861 RepID=UPI0036759822